MSDHHHENHPDLRHRRPARQRCPVLDIGVDRGALVIHTGADLAGREIEVSPLRDHRARVHVAVHPRRNGSGDVVHAAVFWALHPGLYTVWCGPTEALTVVAVREGRVTEMRWARRDIAAAPADA